MWETDLTVWRVGNLAEDPPELAHVPVVPGKAINIETGGVKGSECDVGGIQPVTHQHRIPYFISVQHALGLQCHLFCRILDKPITLALSCKTIIIISKRTKIKEFYLC